MRYLLTLLLGVGLVFAITKEEFRKDREYLSKVEKRLDEIDKIVQKKGPTTELIDELNSYGYPLHTLKDKYLMESGERYEKFYQRVQRAYDKVLYVKRGIFPIILKKEIENLHVPVCDVRSEGKRRERLTIVMKDPKNEKDVMKVMTQTQLQYVHLIGVEEIKFEKCR